MTTMMTDPAPSPAPATPASGGLAAYPRRLLSAFVDVIDTGVARFGTTRRWVAVDLDGQDFAFYRAKRGRTTLFGNGAGLTERQRRTLAASSDEVELRLGAGSIVTTTLDVPASGREYVAQIVEHRLDRLTPWKTENLLYGFATTSTAGQVVVDFMATSREIAAAAIGRLAGYGVAPTTLGSAGEPIDEPLRIDLFRGQNDKSRRTRRRRITALALAIPVALALAAVVSTYFAVQSGGRVAEIDKRIEVARRTLVSGTGNAADRQRDLALIDAKQPPRALFYLMNRLAAIIPDTTYFDGLEIGRDGVRLQGLSSEASALIEILETEPAFDAASFMAPVTRETDGRDRFDIAVTRAADKKATP